jgi:hypothetical protein
MTDVVFNELSFQPAAASPEEARVRVVSFTELLAEARRLGFRGDLRVPEIFFSAQIANGYTISDWIFDRGSPQEHRTYLKSQATKSPFLADLPKLQEVFRISEFRFQGQLAEGLGTAHLAAALAASLDSDNIWRTSTLPIDVLQVDESENLVTSSVDVDHACTLANLATHAARLTSQRLSAIRNGSDLWSQRLDLFPTLTFVEKVEEQTRGLGFHLPHVIRRLSELELCARSWAAADGFDPSSLSGNPRTESPSTLNKYGDQRTFQCPDGMKRTFDWHVNLPGGWRLYFFPVDSDRRIIVGYIGIHLDTVKFS